MFIINQKKINQDILQYKKVECIGYYIPDIEFSSVINETSSAIIRENKVDFNFQSAIFSGEANFFGAIFSGEANFFGTTFPEKADFYRATFSGETDFSVTTFSGETIFYDAKFSEIASFAGAKFSGKAILLHSQKQQASLVLLL